jgi:vesicle transport through interaction with t-SNAREs protein 1
MPPPLDLLIYCARHIHIHRHAHATPCMLMQLERAELEIKSCAKEERGRLLKQVRAMQHQLDLLQQRVNRERHAAQTPAYSLGMHADGDGDGDSDEDIMGAPAHGQDPMRRTLLGHQERIDRTSARVRNATQIALETEAIGREVLGDLHGQRDTIVRVSGALDDTDARLGSTQRTLRSMAWRAMQMKAVWYLIGGALLAIIVVLVYIGVR